MPNDEVERTATGHNAAPYAAPNAFGASTYFGGVAQHPFPAPCQQSIAAGRGHDDSWTALRALRCQ